MVTRIRDSGYKCPVCGHEMTTTSSSGKDLFCRKCFAAVAIIESNAEIHSLMMRFRGFVNEPVMLQKVNT